MTEQDTQRRAARRMARQSDACMEHRNAQPDCPTCITAPTGLPGYFIGRDHYSELHIWRENGDYPVVVLSKRDLFGDLAVWDILAAAIEERP